MAETAPKGPARIVTAIPRERFVQLDWPIEFDGILYEQVRVRRVTGEEVASFIDRLSAGEKGLMPPMVECPVEVYDAMDDDDRLAIDEACVDFLPRRLRQMGELTPSTTEGASPSSQAS